MKFQKVSAPLSNFSLSALLSQSGGCLPGLSVHQAQSSVLPVHVGGFPAISRMLRVSFAIVFLLLAQICVAQDKLGQVVKDQFVKDWQRAKTYTGAFLDAMPAEKFDFRPNDTFMTFTGQMLHLAQYNYNLGAAATGAVNPYGKSALQKYDKPLSKDSVVAIVNSSYDFLIRQLQQLDPAKFTEPADGTTRFHTLEKAYEHQTHHRGSLAVYLRLAGVVPPHEMLY